MLLSRFLRFFVGLQLGVPGLLCLNPGKPVAFEEAVGIVAALQFSKSNTTPSGVVNKTMTAFLESNDDNCGI